MTAHVKDAGSWKQLVGLYVKDGGTWKAVQAGYVKDGGTWKQFYGAGGGGGGGGGGGASVALSPSPANGFTQLYNFNSSGYCSIEVTATPSGFSGSVTYSWSRVSGASSHGAFSASGVSSASCTFGATLPVFVDATETWRCTVTDGTNTAYADVVVTLRVENLS